MKEVDARGLVSTTREYLSTMKKNLSRLVHINSVGQTYIPKRRDSERQCGKRHRKNLR